MKTFNTLHYENNTWILSYTENDIIEQYTSTSLDDIKAKCTEYAFNLDFTGAVDGGK